MRLVGVSMVKNEIDIIEYFVRHNLQFLDALFIIDNGSVDGTREVLSRLMSDERMPIAIFDDPEIAYFQSEKTTKIVCTVDGNFQPDFTFVLDADEFIVANSRQDVEKALSSLPPKTAGRVKWKTYVVLQDALGEAEDIFQTIKYRRIQETPQYHKVVVPKGFSADSCNIVAQGNHYLANKNFQIPHQVVSELAIAHFPVRSLKQLKLKVLLGWLGYLAKKPKNQEGYHWKQLYDLVLSDRLTPEVLSKVSKNYAQQNDILAEFSMQELVEDPLISNVQIRYKDYFQQSEVSTIIHSIEKSIVKADVLSDEVAKSLFLDWSPFKFLHEKYRPESVLQIGCNKGEYVKLFKDAGVNHSLGIGTQPFNDSMLCAAEDYFFYDSFELLSSDTKIETTICVDMQSLGREVGEKVSQFMAMFSTARIVIANASRGQSALLPANEFDLDWYIEYFGNLGWRVNTFDTLVCRSMAELTWFKQSLTVFERSNESNVPDTFHLQNIRMKSHGTDVAAIELKNTAAKQKTVVNSLYDKGFYDAQKSGSYVSAKIYLEKLCSLWQPGSVVDIGCGVGTWLMAFAEIGIPKLVGYDGKWLSQDKMLHRSIRFHPVDLNKPIHPEVVFDLAMSLEVAEHCRPESSDTFVNNLTSLADAILFASAYTQQPGVDHINTRPHSFWAEKFSSQGYLIFDFFRPEFWRDDRVEPFYRQNTFLYIKPTHVLYEILLKNGYSPLKYLGFADCVHPWLYDYFVAASKQLRGKILELQQKSQKPEMPATSSKQARRLNRKNKKR